MLLSIFSSQFHINNGFLVNSNKKLIKKRENVKHVHTKNGFLEDAGRGQECGKQSFPLPDTKDGLAFHHETRFRFPDLGLRFLDSIS